MDAAFCCLLVVLVLAAVLVVILILVILVLILVLILILVLVIHDEISFFVSGRLCRNHSLPKISGFILCFKHETCN